MSTLPQATTARQRLSSGWLDRPRDLWPWLPLVFGLAYALLLLLNLRSVVRVIYTNSDLVSPAYIGELVRQAPPGAHITLGNLLWFPALWLEWLTHWVPAHRQVWELEPYAISLAGVGLIAWSTGRVAGRWAAAMTAVVLTAAAPELLRDQFQWSGHAVTYVVIVVLGIFLVQCVVSEGRIAGALTHAVITTLVGITAAVGVASDPIVIVAGIAPFVLTTAVVVWASPRPMAWRMAITAGAVIAVTLVGVLVVYGVLAAEHISDDPLPLTLATYQQILPNLLTALQSVTFMFYGDFGGLTVTGKSLLKLVCAMVAGAAALTALVVVRDQLRPLVTVRRAQRARFAGRRGVHVTFWCLVILLDTAAYVLSTVPSSEFTGRYLGPAVYGMASVLIVTATSLRRRILVVLGVCILATGSIYSMARQEMQSNPVQAPTGAVSGPLLHFARSEGLKYGYAGYWDSAPLGWQTKEALQVYPVTPCGPNLCRFPEHQISSWYTPRPGLRTFLVSDPTQLGNPGLPAVLGKPVQTVSIGQLTVYVFGYDIASRIASP